MSEIPSMKKISELINFAEPKMKTKVEISVDNNFKTRAKLNELLNNELKSKALLVTELQQVLLQMKDKLLAMEKLQKLTEEENILLTIKNQYLKEQMELVKTEKKL